MNDMLIESATAGSDVVEMFHEPWQGQHRLGKRSRVDDTSNGASYRDTPSNGYGRPGFNIEDDLDPVSLGLCSEAWGRKMFDL